MRGSALVLGLCLAAFSLSACLRPNEISYSGPDSVNGPSGTFTFSFTSTLQSPPQVTVAGTGNMACTLVSQTEVSYTGSDGTCDLTARSVGTNTGFVTYSGESLTQKVAVLAPAPSVSASTNAPVAPSGSAALPEPVQATSPQAAAPSATQATSATPSSSATPPRSTAAPRPSASSAPASPSPTALRAQTVTWNPNTNISATIPSSDGGREFTPSTQATTSGDGAITYSIGSPGTSSCHLRGERVVVVGQNGTCTVIATAASTAKYSAATTSVTFMISNYTDPRPPAPTPTPSLF